MKKLLIALTALSFLASTAYAVTADAAAKKADKSKVVKKSAKAKAKAKK
jgi:hypothetical protein